MSDLTGWCVMCGAKAGEPCRVISGSPDDNLTPGDVRPEPHFYRGSGTPDSGHVAVKDEPPYFVAP